MRKKYRLKVGDEVIVTAGNSKGNSGKILAINRDNDRVTVEDVNIIKKHVKPSATNPQGSISEVEGTIHVSNLMLKGSDGNPTKVGYQIDDKGQKVRIAKKSGEVIK